MVKVVSWNVNTRLTALDELVCMDADAALLQEVPVNGENIFFIRTDGVIDRLGSCAVHTGEPVSALFAIYLIGARLHREQVIPEIASIDQNPNGFPLPATQVSS